MTKPPLGKIAVGDHLLVFEARYNSGRTLYPPIAAVVEKVGRVWVDLREANNVRSQARTWRLRLDTQHDGSKTNYHDRFVTAEQYAWEGRVSDARDVLREAKVTPDAGSPWKSDDRLLALADFIRAHDTSA